MIIRVKQDKGRKVRYVVSSSRLLELLRDLKRIRPGEWLFPGDRPDQPIFPLAINRICREVRSQLALFKR
jgi:integrase/recombinase XerD